MEDLEKIKGFVALIDVLGFRELVGRDDDLSEVKEYIKTVVSVLEAHSPSKLQFVLFSDNLIINTLDESVNSFKSIVLACSHLSFQLSQKRIAVRGAIAHGSFMRSQTTHQGVILAGRPIVEANYYQHAQNWVGTILTPSIVRRDDSLKHSCNILQPNHPETIEQWAERHSLAIHLQLWQQIPFHKSANFDNEYFVGYVVVPMGTDFNHPEKIDKSLADIVRQLETMKLAAPDPKSQEKYARTLSWLKSVKSMWGNIAAGRWECGISQR